MMGLWLIAKRLPLWAYLAFAALVIIAALYASSRYQKARADRAEADARTATATTKALDRVATETPVIRGEQEEKERAVSEIEGSGDRLPDGYGGRLECVRRGNCADGAGQP